MKRLSAGEKIRQTTNGLLRKFFFFALALFAPLFLCACPLKVTIECDKNENLFVSFSSDLGQAFVESLAQIQRISGENGQNSSNLDEISKKIESELNAKFFKNARVKFSQSELSASAQSSAKKLPKEFAAVQKSGGKKTFVLTISPQSLAASILQEDSAAKTLADVLMSPVISGEPSSLDEYKELLAEIYGERLADELLGGELAIEFVAGGKKQVRRVPLSELLLADGGKKFSFDF